MIRNRTLRKKKTTSCDELVRVVDGTPDNRIVIILGDLNAKIGKEILFKPTIGIHSLHKVINNNGLNLIDFETSKGLVIKSTKSFPVKGSTRGHGIYLLEITQIKLTMY